MSISASLSNALSGLIASSRAAELVSSNVANALTEGYGRREIQLSSRTVGGSGSGVMVDGVVRIVDQSVLRDRRLADASLSYESGRASFFQASSSLIGSPDDPHSLSGRLRDFEASLIEASSRPDSEVRLAAIANTARNLASGLNTASDGVQSLRQDADQVIASQVRSLNESLQIVQKINAEISKYNGAGRDVSGLEDQRQVAIDRIAEIIPVRELPREDGKVALVSDGGAVLLDATAAEFGFVETATITPDMTLASGALSGLSLNGRAIATSGEFAPIKGGSLAAHFDIRDELSLDAQAGLDAIAQDLIERFQDPAVDATLSVGDPGMFTDGGGPLDLLDLPGLSGRIEINQLVDQEQSGALWKIRDGLGAAAAGDVGDAGLINSMIGAIGALRVPPATSNLTGAQSINGLIGEMSSRAFAGVNFSEARQSFAAAQQQSLKNLEYAGGVSTDQELQKLLLIEQSYAANARVIQTADEMIQTLIGL